MSNVRRTTFRTRLSEVSAPGIPASCRGLSGRGGQEDFGQENSKQKFLLRILLSKIFLPSSSFGRGFLLEAD
jgi:hypothetical protein